MSNHDNKGRFTKGNKAGVPFVVGNSTAKKNSGYDPSLDDLARRFCLLTNATDEKLAEFLQFSVATLTKYKRDHPSFAAAIRAGKENADFDVAESTHFRATGGMVFETQAVKVKAKDDHTGKVIERVEIVEVQKYIPPDVQAQRLWLMNRSRHWRPENDQPDAKPSQIVNNTTINNTTVIVAQVKDDLSEIFGDALPRASSDDTPRVN
ncbi:MAG: hypothetical protein E5X35_11545 [Mesorhizobium sp.]|uniref:hypothetical protein n=1 Tax=unclassified Mesorhizobium TaxID=325217 RepID=UPI000FCBE465|nr:MULTISPECIES: hypothetical protein [unclassified Mesorhizobium]RUV65216.1 hypothetical protein EOA85_00195 [Mesorhizobium sp. M5C.F.Ca.IN.020.29.1.1]TIM87656.1 MAG: hypothetical protein E5Y50_11525 [Mesorhizobium sp.]TIR33293.1 MAG: hypothetical protein E5X35_11545 [Mesorhizobium sp.]